MGFPNYKTHPHPGLPLEGEGENQRRPESELLQIFARFAFSRRRFLVPKPSHTRHFSFAR